MKNQDKKNSGFTRTPKFGVTPKGGGFTLVETLVAISIFTVSILALLVVLSQGISNTNYAKQKMIASYLAQEGIEDLRNMRDTYVLFDPSLINPAQNGWNAFNSKIAPAPNTLCASANGCYFDNRNFDYTNHIQQTWKNNLIINTCTSSTCANAQLLYDSGTGKYGYAPTPDTVNSGFFRKITVTQTPDQVKVTSTVYWTQGSGSHNIAFSEILFNWIE